MATRKRGVSGEEPKMHPDRDHPIGTFVRNRRRDEHLSQRQLAELAGVGPRVVVELERGKPTLRMDVVNAVLRVFGKTLGIADVVRTEKPE